MLIRGKYTEVLAAVERKILKNNKKGECGSKRLKMQYLETIS